jgi:hypothetical protein
MVLQVLPLSVEYCQTPCVEELALLPVMAMPPKAVEVSAPPAMALPPVPCLSVMSLYPKPRAEMVAPAGEARSSVVALRVVAVAVGASLTAATVVASVRLVAVQALVVPVPP